jgi:hypothetical protein
MTSRQFPEILAARAEIVAPPAPRACEDRTFELPTPILVGVFGLFMAFMAVMSLGFMVEGLVIPMAVNVIFIAAFGYVPAKWALMKPEKRDRAKSWDEFREEGVDTLTGHASAGEAATLVLLLPACILLWGIAVVAIFALT